MPHVPARIRVTVRNHLSGIDDVRARRLLPATGSSRPQATSTCTGFYPGISTNDGSPNLQQGAELLNTAALGTTAIDMRQVFLTFGNDKMSEFKLGRDIGLFQAGAILNDMTLPGVGAGNGNYATPANTSLGSIGLGYSRRLSLAD